MKNFLLLFIFLSLSVHATFNNGAGTGGTTTVAGAVTVTSGNIAVSNFPATQSVAVVTSTLPTGAATSAKQDSLLTELQLKADLTETQPVSIASMPSTPVTGTFFQATQPVSIASMPSTPITAAALPLPSGASTDATVTAMSAKLPAALGIQEATGSTSVVFSNSVVVTGPAALSAVNTDLLTGVVSGWYDARMFKSMSIEVIASAGASGAIIVEQTNDTTAAPNGVSLPMQESFSVTTSPHFGSGSGATITASTVRIWEGALVSRYVRVRISTGITGGTIQGIAQFSQSPYTATRMTVVQGTAASLFATVSGTVGTASAGLNTDIASSAITTTTTTSAITPTIGNGNQFNLAVTAVSGTNPTLDFSIEEAGDNGVNWFTVYQFERVTAVGAYRSPPLLQAGRLYRYVQTVGGTGSPSFTRSLSRTAMSGVPYMVKRFVDRSITLTSLASVTPTYFFEGCTNLQLVITVGAITTTAPALQLKGSEDGTNWYPIGTPLTAVASSTVQLTVNDMTAKFVKAEVSTAGVGVTADHLVIRGF